MYKTTMPTTSHASFVEVSGPFGPFQEINAGIVFLAKRLGFALSAFYAALMTGDNNHSLLLNH